MPKHLHDLPGGTSQQNRVLKAHATDVANSIMDPALHSLVASKHGPEFFHRIFSATLPAQPDKQSLISNALVIILCLDFYFSSNDDDTSQNADWARRYMRTQDDMKKLLRFVHQKYPDETEALKTLVDKHQSTESYDDTAPVIWQYVSQGQISWGVALRLGHESVK